MRLGSLGVILVVKVHKSHSSERVATVEVDEEEVMGVVVVEYVAPRDINLINMLRSPKIDSQMTP